MTKISELTWKTTPVDADKIVIADSADSSNAKSVTLQNLKDNYLWSWSWDMTKAVYDPTNVNGDAFSQDNMVDWATNKNYTATEQTKLAWIETWATADQTGAEIKTLYEAEANTNAFTDAEKTKLTGIETGATADQTWAEIKTLYEAEANTNAFTDAEQSKLSWIEALADVTDATNVAAAGAVMDSDFSWTQVGSMSRTGTWTYKVVKDNIWASVAPTATDDSTSWYEVWSRWIDTTADKEYVCLDATATAAVWTETTQSWGWASTLAYDKKLYNWSIIAWEVFYRYRFSEAKTINEFKTAIDVIPTTGTVTWRRWNWTSLWTTTHTASTDDWVFKTLDTSWWGWTSFALNEEVTAEFNQNASWASNEIYE